MFHNAANKIGWSTVSRNAVYLRRSDGFALKLKSEVAATSTLTLIVPIQWQKHVPVDNMLLKYTRISRNMTIKYCSI